jgi:CTP synthase (UTP-ammonia lyase)
LPHSIETEWVPTDEVNDPATRLARFDGIWVAPGSPYRSQDGALAAIRYAREHGTPLYGT